MISHNINKNEIVKNKIRIRKRQEQKRTMQRRVIQGSSRFFRGSGAPWMARSSTVELSIRV